MSAEVTITNARPPTTYRAGRGWELDPGAILEAVELLGLRRPVRIRWTAGWRRSGCHRTRAAGASYEHHITVSYLRGAEYASRTLWHELAHAFQTERYVQKFRDADESEAAAALRFHGSYLRSRRAYEAEAEDYTAFHDDLPLSRDHRTNPGLVRSLGGASAAYAAARTYSDDVLSPTMAAALRELRAAGGTLRVRVVREGESDWRAGPPPEVRGDTIIALASLGLISERVVSVSDHVLEIQLTTASPEADSRGGNMTDTTAEAPPRTLADVDAEMEQARAGVEANRAAMTKYVNARKDGDGATQENHRSGYTAFNQAERLLRKLKAERKELAPDDDEETSAP
jgi:hypothetical protein